MMPGKIEDAYDFIIIGAGSSGCVLADRLSADPAVRVLVVESGPDDTSTLIRMPRGIGKLLTPGNAHVWDYQVSPGGNAPDETWVKGRAVGGSSSINGMVYVRGAPYDYDSWDARGCTGWGWNEIGPLFQELENHSLGAKPFRGAAGPLRVSVHPSGDPLCEAVLNAAGEMGVPRVDDINDMPAVMNGGMGYQPTTTWRGKRYSAARAFLTAARRRSNLNLVTETEVLRIVFEDQVATGIVLRNKDGQRTVCAKREVILSAGAIHTPKLLQLSGIGPAALLQAHGISVVVDAPEVGRNLLDHRYLLTQYRVTGNSLNDRFSGLGLLRSLLSYGLFSKGPLTHSAHEVGGFVKTRTGIAHPDAQIGLGLYSVTTDGNGVSVDPYPGLPFSAISPAPKAKANYASSRPILRYSRL
jgi:choline dehydrogenase